MTTTLNHLPPDIRNGPPPDYEEPVAEEDEGNEHRVIAWPVLNPKALHGVAGDIVNAVMPHTEADPAAVLVTLLAQFGAAVGRTPYFYAGGAKHHAVIHPLIVGRTSDGVKGTSLAIVNAICQRAQLDPPLTTASGLSTGEGLIEHVQDSVGDDPDAKGFKAGVEDKRLLVKETEYKLVLSRGRREGASLLPILRQLWDGDDVIQTMTKEKNRVRASHAHIVVVGHVTPGEFMRAVDDSDVAGGSINRLLICLSRRSKVDPKMGNVPEEVLAPVAEAFRASVMHARQGPALATFSNAFWARWNELYPKLVIGRAENAVTGATARRMPYILRLSLLYALMDRADPLDCIIGDNHLDAALALWNYCEHSAQWLFSDYEGEQENAESKSLVKFIRDAKGGRTRTEISRDHFQRHKTRVDIDALLNPLIHEGVIQAVEDGLPAANGKRATRYVLATTPAN
jgi:hypothetical protein